METHESRSEVARLMEQIRLQEEAAQRGLSGLAIVADHESINARMERGAKHLLQLVQEGKGAEAFALMSTDTWAAEEEGS